VETFSAYPKRNKQTKTATQIKKPTGGVEKFHMFRIFFQVVFLFLFLMCDKLKANAKLCYTCNEKNK